MLDRIGFRSDTVTQPTEAMRAAMAAAPEGISKRCDAHLRSLLMH